ncbi:MAG: hypothetical protein DMG14_10070 [Acidobacteria bacterium]|nr:MAG: hypothetical protein DMG14_10070 [Acidobacteriota bacterium]
MVVILPASTIFSTAFPDEIDELKACFPTGTTVLVSRRRGHRHLLKRTHKLAARLAQTMGGYY